MKSLTAIIPTTGRPSLKRTLDSIRGQDLKTSDTVIICGDAYGKLDTRLIATVRGYGHHFDYVKHSAGCHAWGHPQINRAMEAAEGDYLVFNDDDDIFVPGAFDAIRMGIESQSGIKPLMYRFKSYLGNVYWQEKGLVELNRVGGHCIVPPNDKPKLGKWSNRYVGDFDFIKETLDHYPASDWNSTIISVARPMYGWKRPETDSDIEDLRRMRNAGRMSLTRNQHEISEKEQREWWTNIDPREEKVYLYTDQNGERNVGAGRLSKREDGRWYITVLTYPEHRRKGLGRFIYRSLAYAFPYPIFAEIADENPASTKAAEYAGYNHIGHLEKEKVHYMVSE